MGIYYESTIGPRIVEATSKTVLRFFQTDPKYRYHSLLRNEVRLTDKRIDVTPSTLTARVVMSEFAGKRLSATVETSKTLPPEAILHIEGAIKVVDSLSLNLIMLQSLNGFPNPYDAYQNVLKNSNTDPSRFDGLVEFTRPAHASLAQKAPDEELIDLLETCARAAFLNGSSERVNPEH